MSEKLNTATRSPGALDAMAASIMVLLCTVWGLNQVAVKVASVEISPFVQAGGRSFFSALLVVVWCRFRGITIFKRDGTLWPGLVTGLLFTLEFAFFFLGVPRTTAARAVLFFYTAPFFIAIGAHFFLPNESMRPIHMVGLCLAFLGVSLSFADSLRSDASAYSISGDIMCLLAAAFWGMMVVVVKATKLVTIAPERSLLYQLVMSSILVPVGLLIGEQIPQNLSFVPAISFVYQVACVASASFLTFFWLMTKYDAAKLGAFIFLAPVFGVFFGWTLLGETVTIGLAVGAALICGGIWLVNRR
ncbi:MAG: DMT family transporter [Hyphomicrobiales bacterium]